MSRSQTAWVRFGWRAAVVGGMVVVALGLAGCGGGSGTGSAASDGIKASVGKYVTALAKHDAAGACNVVTGAYWSATATELVSQLRTKAYAGLPSETCQQGLKRLFSGSKATGSVPKFAVSNVHVHGRTAIAHLTLGKSTSDGSVANSRFVKAPSGIWRIDCCTGSQLATQRTATYRVPSAAMLPTLKLGQIVTMDNTAFRSRAPRLGDIVLFHPPASADTLPSRCGARGEGSGHPAMCGVPTPSTPAQETMIKRVVGLPGDRLAMRGGHVIRDGAREPEPYINACTAGQTTDCTFPKTIVVPAEDYFVLGDNRSVSEDSRFFGPVKRAWIIGLVKP